jgi:hypothetical protein
MNYKLHKIISRGKNTIVNFRPFTANKRLNTFLFGERKIIILQLLQMVFFCDI